MRDRGEPADAGLVLDRRTSKLSTEEGYTEYAFLNTGSGTCPMHRGDGETFRRVTEYESHVGNDAKDSDMLLDGKGEAAPSEVDRWRLINRGRRIALSGVSLEK